jgi:hypothetical protein
MNKCIVTCVEKGIQCTTILTALLITLNAMIPISTLQYLETSPLSPHSTPEHDSIGQHAKHSKQEGKKISPDQPARSRALPTSLCKPRLSLSFPSPSPIPLHQSDSHSHSQLLTTWHARQARVVEEGTKDRECGSPADYDIKRLVSRMRLQVCTTFKVTHSLFAVCLLSFCLLPSKHHCHEAGESTKRRGNT